MGCFGLERLHPFDARKYGRAWARLRRSVPRAARVRPERPASREDLLRVHTAAYLDRLTVPAHVAAVLELPPLRLLPRWLLERALLRPMRWATMGTVVATREALDHGFAVNLGGGFHHAKPAGGEGFCVYNDIALAIHVARREGRVSAAGRVAYVDLDAHQGNGVSHCFMQDAQVRLFDMFNAEIYPSGDAAARARVDHPVPLGNGCPERDYLDALQAEFPAFLAATGPCELAIYNAGTDVYEHDPLGGLGLSAAGIRARDAFVVSSLRAQGIPTVMLLSGGYTRESYRLVADSVRELLAAHSPAEDA